MAEDKFIPLGNIVRSELSTKMTIYNKETGAAMGEVAIPNRVISAAGILRSYFDQFPGTMINGIGIVEK